jgi:hypothetical protein
MYAQFRKQQVYVPYSNPLNTAVKGYSDFVPTDRVLLSADRGTIAGLTSSGYVSSFFFTSSLIATSVITAGVNLASTTLTGTTFLSVTPDLTYVEFTSPGGLTQLVSQASFTTHTAVSIVVPDAAVTIGSVTPGWLVRVFANSKYSNQFVLT